MSRWQNCTWAEIYCSQGKEDMKWFKSKKQKEVEEDQERLEELKKNMDIIYEKYKDKVDRTTFQLIAVDITHMTVDMVK